VATALAGSIDDLSAKLTNLTAAHDTTRTALAATRAMADKLAEHARSSFLGEPRLEALAATALHSPLLSIAIPSFNRPIAFKELLSSIADEVAACPPGTIEVCITDDASPDLQTIETAVAFTESHQFASLRIQPANVGLERNVMAAGEACSGEYLMLVGNDDLLASGVLTKILEDISEGDAPVLLYGKSRINLDGSPRPDIPGSIPVEIGSGATHRFPSMIDASRRQGFLSTFGFAGPMVVQRVPFMAIDPGPYLDLTMYARTAVLLEAFSQEPVLYHNVEAILHRTATPEHKHAESLGRKEEDFMAGGRTRLARYYGTSLAATLQRLIDRGAFDHDTIATMPEMLMTDLTLVNWIVRNRRIDPRVDERLGGDVVADAERFLAAQAALAPRLVQ
jgi:glycosyltransferase involved in cell wall biosynthesis